MFKDFPLFPRAASTAAGQIDTFYFFMVGVCGLLAVGVVFFIIYFALKYRRRHEDEPVSKEEAPIWLELVWTITPFFILMVMFGWGAWLFFEVSRPPAHALDVYVTAKQWMWKFQHVGGRSEINSLHVPVGRPVRLIMASEDVIHSFFVPEFRVHTDVLPHRYTYNWFEATVPGTYHLFCSEYCGTEHSRMIGSVYVLEPEDYQVWLAGGIQGSPAEAGQKLFVSLTCSTCHSDTATARGPVLTGLFGRERPLQDGSMVRVDENYLRQSILNPGEKIAAGYQPIMPSFQGQVNEEQLVQLISYIKTLTPPTGGGLPAGAGSAGATSPSLAPPPPDGSAPPASEEQDPQ